MQSRINLTAVAALTLAIAGPTLAADHSARYRTESHANLLSAPTAPEPESMDPAVAETVPPTKSCAICSRADRHRHHRVKLCPVCAESWKQTNPTTWVFKLRTNAKFSNGDPVTADDFVYGIPPAL